VSLEGVVIFSIVSQNTRGSETRAIVHRLTSKTTYRLTPEQHTDATITIMVSYLSGAITAFGLFGLAKLAYNTACVLWLQLLRPSQLHKYRHADSGSWALVTGASDGIGLELARELLAQGFNVFIHGRNKSKLEGVQKSLKEQHPNRSIEIIVADAADSNTDYAAIVAKTISVPGKLTVLINCVGGITTNPIFTPLDKLSGADIDTNIAINARFPTRLTAALLPVLKANSPSLIINAGSYAGILGLPYIATYTATKAYIHTFTRALRAELECDGFHDVEVIGSLIGDTSTSRNDAAENIMKVSAASCARGMLAKAGCGETLVAPDLRHWVTGLIVQSLPDGVGRKIMFSEMRKRREEEGEKIRKGE
jgi:17beta-estradiol 17-dehydrogenase / very-long-chain 3-oxoacyl-CoA reductase